MIIIIIIIIVIIIIIIEIIIALKIANLLSAPQTVSNTYAQMARAQSCADYVQHIERLLRATYRVPKLYKGAAQLISLTECKFYILF